MLTKTKVILKKKNPASTPGDKRNTTKKIIPKTDPNEIGQISSKYQTNAVHF